MVRLELSPEEHTLLIQILEEFLSDLRMEIVDTDAWKYKEALRTEKHVVNDLLEKARAAK